MYVNNKWVGIIEQNLKAYGNLTSKLNQVMQDSETLSLQILV